MKSKARGKSTLRVEVTNVSPQGFWMLLDEREFFLPFSDFPWFANATIRELTTVERPLHHHLYWPELDIDLHLDSIEHPEEFPLVAKGID